MTPLDYSVRQQCRDAGRGERYWYPCPRRDGCPAPEWRRVLVLTERPHVCATPAGLAYMAPERNTP